MTGGQKNLAILTKQKGERVLLLVSKLPSEINPKASIKNLWFFSHYHNTVLNCGGYNANIQPFPVRFAPDGEFRHINFSVHIKLANSYF